MFDTSNSNGIFVKEKNMLKIKFLCCTYISIRNSYRVCACTCATEWKNTYRMEEKKNSHNRVRQEVIRIE